MPRGRKLMPLILDPQQQDQLEGVARSTTMPHGVVLRARMILACAEGLTNAAGAERVGASPQAVSKWRRRFLEAGIAGSARSVAPRPTPHL